MQQISINPTSTATLVPPILAPPVITCAPQPRASQTSPPPHSRTSTLSNGFFVVSALLFVFVMCIVGVTGYFRLSSETAALRTGVMSTVPGVWDKKIALHVGWLTTTVIRTGSRLFNLPPEPRAALDALHGAEVGIYKLQHDPGSLDFPAFFASSDRTMKSQGWDRVLGVAKDHQFVGVYFPHRKVSLKDVKCCVVVLQGRDLVVASVTGNLEPLLKLAENRPEFREFREHLSAGMKPLGSS